MTKKKRKIKARSKRYLYGSIVFLALITLFLAVAFPSLPSKLFTHGSFSFLGDTAKPNLQLYWFMPTFVTPTSVPASPLPTSPTTPMATVPITQVPSLPPNQSPVPTLPEGGDITLDNMCFGGFDDNGLLAPENCMCFDLSIHCRGGVPYNDEDGTILDPFGPGVVYIGDQSHLNNLCQGSPIAPSSDGRYCIAKPVIYLYPEVQTLVDVKVESTGEIVVSDPLYPGGGWKNVIAFPDGKLLYRGKEYSELFFETEVTDYARPEKGLVIKSSELRMKLDGIIDRLGLVGHEKKEFLSFWIPRLEALNSPYIFFSVIDKTEKERLDKVIITPAPETVIEFIAYFKPVESPEGYDNSLHLPSKPVRKGFTSVEWGGSLDR